MNEVESIEDMKSKVESLSKIKEEAYRTVLQLNITISENVVARDTEITKMGNLQKNIDSLQKKIYQVEKSEIQSEE